MTGPVFVDTNVFVYLHDDSEPQKKTRADEWISLLVRDRSGRVSFQVLQELYSTLTSKRRLKVDVAEARLIVRELAVWQPVAVDLAMLETSLGLAGPLSLVLVGRAHHRRRADLRVQGSADRGPATRPRIRRGSGGQSV